MNLQHDNVEDMDAMLLIIRGYVFLKCARLLLTCIHFVV